MGLPTLPGVMLPTTDAPLEEKPSLLQAYRRKPAPGLWVGPTLALTIIGREWRAPGSGLAGQHPRLPTSRGPHRARSDVLHRRSRLHGVPLLGQR
jgi:hypothetical protein